MIILGIIIFIFFASVTLCGLKIYSIYSPLDSKGYQEREFITNLNSIRGIFAIEIVVGHVMRYEQAFYLAFWGKIMICPVSYFFFVSAYTMSVSYRSNKNYLDGFITKKPLFLVVAAVIVYTVGVILDYFISYDLGYVDKGLFLGFIHTTNWYVFEMTLFYVLFYLLYSYIKNAKKRIITAFMMTFLMSIFFYVMNFHVAYMTSMIGFPMGILFGEYGCFRKSNTVRRITMLSIAPLSLWGGIHYSLRIRIL